MRTTAILLLGSAPALGQAKSCLAHGVLQYTDKSNPRTVPLSLAVAPHITLIASFVPTFGEAHEARKLNVTFQTKSAPNQVLKIVARDVWFGPDQAVFDPVPFAMNNDDAPDFEEIRLPQLGLGVRLDMEKYDVSNAPFQFFRLQLGVCVHP